VTGGALTWLTGYNHRGGAWEGDKIRIFILGRGLASSPDPSPWLPQGEGSGEGII